MHDPRDHFYYGWVVVGISAVTLILVPATQFAVERWGWRTAYTTLALVVMGCVVPLTAIWQRHRPADPGLRPDGATAPEPAEGPAVLPAAPQSLRRHLTGVLRGHRFWCLFVLTVGMGWMANVVVVHQIAHMTDNGFSAVLAAVLMASFSNFLLQLLDGHDAAAAGLAHQILERRAGADADVGVVDLGQHQGNVLERAVYGSCSR